MRDNKQRYKQLLYSDKARNVVFISLKGSANHDRIFILLIQVSNGMPTLTAPTISKKDLKFIDKNRINYREKPIRIRLSILWFSTKFDCAMDIAEFSGCSLRHVFNVIKSYNQGGLTAILNYDKNKPTSELEPYADLIKKNLEENPPASAKEIKDRIRKLTGINKSVSQVINFIKSIGMKYLKPSMIPMGKNEVSLEEKSQRQKEFASNVLDSHIKDHNDGKCKLLFMDASHIQIACMLGCIWCFVKKYVPALPLRGRVNIIGAVSPHGEDFIYDISQSSVNQEAIISFLRKLSAKFKGDDIRVVLDNASYHHAIAVKDLASELGITLVFLPVASPNLNIIERLWKFIKGKFLKNQVFVHLDELEMVLSNRLKTLRKKYKNDLRRLLTTNFQLFDGGVQSVTG